MPLSLPIVTVHGLQGQAIAFWRVSPPPTPPHHVADLSVSVMASSFAATLRGGGHAPPRERLPADQLRPVYILTELAGHQKPCVGPTGWEAVLARNRNQLGELPNRAEKRRFVPAAVVHLQPELVASKAPRFAVGQVMLLNDQRPLDLRVVRGKRPRKEQRPSSEIRGLQQSSGYERATK
jgi:hypothetical protein